jgi:hypothetical protein
MEQLRFRTFVAHTLPPSKDKFEYENEVDLAEAEPVDEGYPVWTRRDRKGPLLQVVRAAELRMGRGIESCRTTFS